MKTLLELIYISEVAPATTIANIAEVLVEARTKNAARGISGVLIFDGNRFMQLFEGESNTVMQLFRRIEQDTRHINVRWLHDAVIEQRQFASFQSGYWYDDSEHGPIASLNGVTGANLRNAMMSRIEAFDLSG